MQFLFLEYYILFFISLNAYFTSLESVYAYLSYTFGAIDLTLEAPVVLHYLKAPTAVKLTGVLYRLLIEIMLSKEGKYLNIINCLKVVIYFVMFYTYDVSNRPVPGNIADNEWNL